MLREYKWLLWVSRRKRANAWCPSVAAPGVAQMALLLRGEKRRRGLGMCKVQENWGREIVDRSDANAAHNM